MFAARAFVEVNEGELFDLYRKEMDEITSFGGTPVGWPCATILAPP